MQERVRGLPVQEVKGLPEDKQAAENVCTFPVQDPAGAMGWECLERLRGNKWGQRHVCWIGGVIFKWKYSKAFVVNCRSYVVILIAGAQKRTYLWSVSDRHGADDQCVSCHRVLGQLGVC